MTNSTDTDEAKAAYNWLANLTDIDDFTDDWASKTYEPTIGMESKNESNTRVVVVADIDHARMNFASNLATVDVNTKLIPHLSKIVYCTVDQVGDNFGSAYAGTAYYRFGDVVEDAEGYYWVCVKPAFGTGRAPQQQGYWMNILNRDPVNGNTILLPTKLNSTKEMTHGLANLIWALLDPEAYHKTVGDNGVGLGGYDYQYNGAKFCQRVAEQWKNKHIWEKLFNRRYDQMQQMEKLNFYYEGYHFTPRVHNGSANLGCAVLMGTERYEKTFVTSNKEDSKKNIEMKKKGAGFDMRRYCSDPEQDKTCAIKGKAGYAPKEQFTDTEGYWIVRMKTSSDIVGSKPSVYAALNNTREIYRYNQAYEKMVGSESPVETEGELAEKEVISEYGSILPGTVIEGDHGSKWFCFSNWIVSKDLRTSSKKARFISVSDIDTEEEDLADADNGATGHFIKNEDLPSKADAPIVAAFLNSVFVMKNGNESEKKAFDFISEQLTAMAMQNLSEFETRRKLSLTIGDVSYPGCIYSINVACQTFFSGSQPYLRCVLDYSGLGENKNQLPQGMRYGRLRFYSKYTANTGIKNEILDLTHTFRDSGFMGEGKVSVINGDQYSTCEDYYTGKSILSFTIEDLQTMSYNTRYYLLAPNRHMTPYFEKCYVVRYRELDVPSGPSESTYNINGEQYRVMTRPTEDVQETISSVFNSILRSGHNPGGNFNWCEMDGEPYEMNVHSVNSSWPKEGDWQQ